MRQLGILATLLFAAWGCSDAAAPAVAGSFPPMPIPADNPTTEAKTELGRLLFYDPVLSADGEVACATCHSEIWGMGDGLVVSVGIDGEGPTGPGRDGPNKTTRNSMTLWNVGWRASLFWDGRSSSLEEQALLPIENEIEMGRDIDSLIADLREIDGYQLLFAAAFPTDFEPITAANLARALAALQRTFVSDWAPYDRYMAGDIGALKPDVVQGMHLFAEAGCESCHTPPLFESERYVARGIDGDDEGRFEQTADPADRGAFRIPTLRNLRETGPYFHDGSVTTLEEAVAHEAAISAARNEGLALNSDEVEKVARFINKALMDRSREPYRPKEVPSGLEVPKDGFRIPR